MINEILYDTISNDDPNVLFTELWGTPGTDIGGWTLVGINGNGGTEYGTLTIPDGTTIPADGYFVIPYTIGGYLATIKPGAVKADNAEFKKSMGLPADEQWGPDRLGDAPVPRRPGLHLASGLLRCRLPRRSAADSVPGGTGRSRGTAGGVEPRQARRRSKGPKSRNGTRRATALARPSGRIGSSPIADEIPPLRRPLYRRPRADFFFPFRADRAQVLGENRRGSATVGTVDGSPPRGAGS